MSETAEHAVDELVSKALAIKSENDRLRVALQDVRQELWVDFCLHAGRTDIDPAPFNARPHIRIIDDALNERDFGR